MVISNRNSELSEDPVPTSPDNFTSKLKGNLDWQLILNFIIFKF